MKKNSIILSIALFLFFSFIGINFASASLLSLMQPYNANDTDSRIRSLERKQFYDNLNSYESPESKMARMVVEMAQQNKANEKLKEEIKAEIGTKTQKVKTINCSESLGENSKYNSDSKKCECLEEYKLYKNKCISKSEYGNEYCKETSGINSKYDNENDKCLTNEDYCKEKMGYGSRYSIGNEQCECVGGFVLNDNICVEEKKEEIKVETKPSSFSNRIINFFQKLKFW